MGGRFTLFSLIVSNIGLSAIITYSVPVLMLIYPPAITLILLALLEMHSSIAKSLCLRYHLFLGSFHL